MQADNFIYFPAWVKIGAIFLLTFTLLGAFGIALEGVLHNREEGWIITSMSVVQVCISGLGLALVIFFSQRTMRVENLVAKADQFMQNDVPAAVKRLESLTPGKVGVLAKVKLDVAHAQVASLDAARAAVASSINRAEQIGFKTDFAEEVQERDGRTYVILYLIQDLDAGFPFDTERRLALLQQFTLILRSACLAARREGLRLGYEGG